MLKLKSESKDLTALLQEDKKHIVIPQTILQDLNSISKATRIDQQRLSTEILMKGLKRICKHYHLTNSN